MAASFFSPMPETRVKSSMDENGPFASLWHWRWCS